MDDWTALHFSQANPQSEGQDDVAALLRRVAETLDELGDVSVHDITFHVELSADGESPTMTV